MKKIFLIIALFATGFANSQTTTIRVFEATGLSSDIPISRILYLADSLLALRNSISSVGNASTATALQTGRTIGITGDVTYTSPSFTGAANVTAAATVTRLNGQSLAALATGILKNTTGTGVPSIATAADFPPAVSLQTARNIYGNAFDGTAAVTGIILPTYGGTGNAFTRFFGASSSEKTYTLPNASTTILTTNDLVTVAQGGSGLATVATNSYLKGNGTGALVPRTYAEVKSDLGLNNVDNTSDATERAATATLTNKTIVNPIMAMVTNTGAISFPTVTGTLSQYTEATITSSATPSPTGNARENWLDVTALATNATFAAPSGTAANHNYLIIRVKDNGSARTLAFNAIYRFSTDLVAPTTTVAGKEMYMQFHYNSGASKWDYTGSTIGF